LATLAGTETLSGKTLTTPKFADLGYIADANGNEQIMFATTASAVTYLKLFNGATGNYPILLGTGEANTGIDLATSGTGTIRLIGNSTQAGEIRLYEDTDNGFNYTAFKVGTQAGDLTYTLPTAAPGGDGYSLTSTTGGVLSWTAPGAASVSIGSSITSGTEGSVLYVDSSNQLAEDNANFFWNATNHELGIGTTSPVGNLDVTNIGGGVLDAMNLGTESNITFSVSSNDDLYGLYFGQRFDGGTWVQAGRTDSATAYNLYLQGSGGNVGIGVTTSSHTLEVGGTGNFSGALTASNFSGTSSGDNTGDQNLSGYALLSGATFGGSISASNLSGTNTGDQDLSGYALLSGATFSGAISAAGITNSSVTGCNTGNYLVTDAGGVIGCEASSIRYKENINDLVFDKEKFLSLTPVTFNFKKDFRLNIPDTQVGFIAEQVEPIFPDLVVYKNGQIEGIKYANLSMYLFQVAKDQQKDIDIIKEFLDINSTASDVSGVSPSNSIFDIMKEKLVAWFADAANGIGDFVAGKIHTQELCVGGNGSETCLTKPQVDNLLNQLPNNSGGSGGSSSGSSGDNSSPPDSPSTPDSPPVTDNSSSDNANPSPDNPIDSTAPDTSPPTVDNSSSGDTSSPPDTPPESPTNTSSAQ
jgi:hypothetical protein